MRNEVKKLKGKIFNKVFGLRFYVAMEAVCVYVFQCRLGLLFVM